MPLTKVDASNIIDGVLPVANGGTGLTSPGASGNVLTSNGTSWVSSALAEVKTPVNSSPANGATGVGSPTPLVGSTYYSLYGIAQSASQWQISTSTDFSSPVYSSGDQAASTSFTVPFGSGLNTSTTYYWRVRYKDANGVYSSWSEPTSFTTASAFTYNVDYLVVAGGGGGAAGWTFSGFYLGGGGGGAGGYLSSTSSVTPATAYTITIGAGGNGASGNVETNTNGSNSSFGAIATAIGGGKGAFASSGVESNGGSGGGASYSGLGGSGTAGQGNAGGNQNGGFNYAGAGGGGKGSAGTTVTETTSGGAGGAGESWFDSVARAGGGGGGGVNSGTGGSAVAGGGAGGGSNNGRTGVSGTANTGGGGGAGGTNGTTTFASAAGGSGIVIIRYTGTPRASGGTITQSGGYTYHTFTGSGTFTA